MLRRKTVHSVLTLIALLALTAPPTGAENPVACTITARSEESIQAAIDRAPEHAVICLPEGEWHENLTITKSLILQGSGPGLSVIMARDEDKPVISISSSGEGAAVDVMIESITVAGASLRFGWGIKIEDTTEAAIVGCSIRDNSGGISLLESCQALITGCTIEGNDGDGICVEAVSYTHLRAHET